MFYVIKNIKNKISTWNQYKNINGSFKFFEIKSLKI